jgi:hypothetical protein
MEAFIDMVDSSLLLIHLKMASYILLFDIVIMEMMKRQIVFL